MDLPHDVRLECRCIWNASHPDERPLLHSDRIHRGFWRHHAQDGPCPIVAMVQMLADLAVLAVVVRLILGAVTRGIAPLGHQRGKGWATGGARHTVPLTRAIVGRSPTGADRTASAGGRSAPARSRRDRDVNGEGRRVVGHHQPCGLRRRCRPPAGLVGAVAVRVVPRHRDENHRRRCDRGRRQS